MTNNKYINNENVYELTRFATDVDFRVPGIASKMIKTFFNNYKWTKVYSYADYRWSDGKLYETLGFIKTGLTPPNYHYIIDGKRKHRWAYRKDSLREKFPDQYNKNLTEYQNMLSLGYDRIWDCGSLKYTITKPT